MEEDAARWLLLDRGRPSAVRLLFVDDGREGAMELLDGVLLREAEAGVGVRGTLTVRRMTSGLGRDLGTHGFCLVNMFTKELDEQRVRTREGWNVEGGGAGGG